MAKAFLRSVADFIFENYEDKVENLCLILPNKRGALFLKNYLAQSFGKTIWLPTIISAEDLIAELSGLKVLEEIDLICHLFESYKSCYGKDAEPFDSFAKWGQLILQDFNEIDRYLADPQQLYENLKDIKVIENWSLGEEILTEYQNNYLRFMTSLGAIYEHFSAFLLSNKWAYQGLAYRQAVLNLKLNQYDENFHKLLFCGFNALNAAELKILDHFYLKKKADLLWDADEYYLNNPNQEAGLFLRNNFKFFPQKNQLFIESNFLAKKDITVISVSKQIGQAQVVKQTLEKLIQEGVALDKVAVVLANEKLLWPVLKQLPAGIDHVNITMEYPIKYTSSYGFIELLLQIQIAFNKQNRVNKTIYHKDLVALLRQPIFQDYLLHKGFKINTQSIINQIAARNLSFISQKNLEQLFGEDYHEIKPLVFPLPGVLAFCVGILKIVGSLVEFYSNEKRNNAHSLELEYLQIILKNFNRLNDILTKYTHFNDLHSFKQLYTQIVGSSSAPFIGEPLSGLQIMGVLETRTLDFEHLILVNVNEGVLPSGKTINSFIPNDLKRAFGLPLYLEKDAIYAYHFYRLLQRADNIVITYDSETDSFGKGEKSRFVTQLQLEMNRFNPEIRISEEVASYTGFPEETDNTIVVNKTQDVLSPILKKASSNEQYGALSPSGLITYKECGLKFYFRYGAHLKEAQEVEESAEASTFGSILHLSLENLYKEFSGKVIDTLLLTQNLNKVDHIVHESFISFFDGAIPSGKNLLQEEVIKVYVKKLVNADVTFIRKLKNENHFLTLQYLEKEFQTHLEVELDGVPTQIYIKGKIDRIDSYSGQVRLIDFKSSVKDSDKFAFDGFEKLFYDKNYNKQFQLMLYAWLLHKNNFCEPEKLKPCIIPFKNFSEEPKYLLGIDKKSTLLTKSFLLDFENALKDFIAEIFSPQTPFIQTEDKKICQYCAYNTICNISV